MPEIKLSKLVLKLREEAQALLGKGENPAAIFNKASSGLFMYKKKPADKFIVAYSCAKCGNEERTEMNLEVPYTVNCGKCSNLIYKQEKVPKKGVKKLAK